MNDETKRTVRESDHEFKNDDLVVTAPLEEGGVGAASWMPATIGNCRVLRVLGAGGMGVVFLAQQDEPRRKVAIKVLSPSVTSDSVLRRFRRESEALALLQHPGVAQIYDVGVDQSQGREIPYIIMELIEGKPLNAHAAEHKLTLREKLDLAARVCDAVEHAHQKGVIHRDLKPGNILVDDSGQPKVLDFGIARVTQDETLMTRETEAGQLLGTVAYMSPEQAAGDPNEVDTRSDVYSMGVVLYEMLAGRLPLAMEKASLLEIARLIREVDPVQLSSIDTRMRGDVDTIVGKALEKEKDRRYQSAGEFAEDIRRYLTDKPIAAHAPSTLYQLRKFTRRNRALVAGVAAVFVTLLGGLIATGAALAKESEARREAEALLERSNAATGFLESALLSVTPDEAAGRDTELMLMVLGNAAASIDEDLSAYPEIQAEMLSIVGSAYRQIGELDLAVASLRRSIETYDRITTVDHPDRLRAAYVLMGTHRIIGDAETAAALGEESIAALAAQDPAARDLLLYVNFLRERAQVEILEGNFEAAMMTADEALAELAGSDDEIAFANVHAVRGNTLRRMDRLEEAEESYRRSLEVYESDEHYSVRDIVDTLNSLAIIYRTRGQREDGAAMYRRAITLRRDLDPRPDSTMAIMLTNFSRLLLELGELDEAEKHILDSIVAHREIFGDEHFGIAIAIAMHADLLARRGQTEESLARFDEAIDLATSLLGSDHPFLVTMWTTRSMVLMGAQRYEEAESDARRALAVVEARNLPARSYRAVTLMRVAEAVHHQGRIEEARSLCEAATDCLPADDPRQQEYWERFESWGSEEASAG